MKHLALLLSVALLGGCEVAAEPVAVGPDYDGAVQPGYYYDEAYVDGGGAHHPREYWYHDDHGWAHRDAVPAGTFVHGDRTHSGYAHGGHADADHGGGDHSGGDHGGGHGH